VEKKDTALKKMLATVLRDKSKIEETIIELDRYKRDALHKTWEKVNGWVDFEGESSQRTDLGIRQGLWGHLRRAPSRQLCETAASGG
jgi:hypothetical protein